MIENWIAGIGCALWMLMLAYVISALTYRWNKYKQLEQQLSPEACPRILGLDPGTVAGGEKEE